MKSQLIDKIFRGLKIYSYEGNKCKQYFIARFIDSWSLKGIQILLSKPAFLIIIAVIQNINQENRIYPIFTLTLFSFLLLISIICRTYFVLERYGHFIYHSYCHLFNQIVNKEFDINDYINLSRFYTDFKFIPVCFRDNFQVEINIKNNIWLISRPFYAMLSFFINTFITPGIYWQRHFFNYDKLHNNRLERLKDQNTLRFKIQTSNGLLIDVYFAGYSVYTEKTLVIISDGVGRTAERKCDTNFNEANYPTLRWNFPGYGESTGSTFHYNIVTASTAIIEFAINCLKYEEKNIVLYGWSMGCYAASIMGKTHRDFKGIILDAPFDEISPAILRLPFENIPNFVELLIQRIKELYYDYDIYSNISKYDECKKIKMILKSDDTILLKEKNNKDSNLGLRLIEKLIQHRLSTAFSADEINLIKLKIENIPRIEDVLENHKSLSYKEFKIESENNNFVLLNKKVNEMIKLIALRIDGTHYARYDKEDTIRIMNYFTNE